MSRRLAKSFARGARAAPPPTQSSFEDIEAQLKAGGFARLPLEQMSAEELLRSAVFQSRAEEAELRRLRRFQAYQRQQRELNDREAPAQRHTEELFREADFGVAVESKHLREPRMVYPGSNKGILPEDDPDYFDNWFYQNLSPEARQRLFLDQNDRESLLGAPSELLSTITEEDVVHINTEIANPHERENTHPELLQLDSRRYAFDPELEGSVPDVPHALPLEEEAAFEKIYNWVFLRNVAALDNVVPRILDTFSLDYEEIKRRYPQFASKTGAQYYPSLFAYYNLLPREMRENSNVVSVLRALERHGHHLSLAEKQEMLNRACRYSLPLCETDRVVITGIDKSRKYHPTMADQINLENPEEEDNINSRRRILLAQTTDEWQTPPRNLDPSVVQDTMPMTPLEYYINDDGYWDDYIREKEKLRATVPLPTNRPSFKH